LLIAIAPLLGWVLFEAGVLLFDVFEKRFAKLFGVLDFVGIGAAEAVSKHIL
jgi:hypothetical protein